MSQKSLWIVISIVAGIIIIMATVWFLRSRETGDLFGLNPFSKTQSVSTGPIYDPPSDYSSSLDGVKPAATGEVTPFGPAFLPPTLSQ